VAAAIAAVKRLHGEVEPAPAPAARAAPRYTPAPDEARRAARALVAAAIAAVKQLHGEVEPAPAPAPAARAARPAGTEPAGEPAVAAAAGEREGGAEAAGAQEQAALLRRQEEQREAEDAITLAAQELRDEAAAAGPGDDDGDRDKAEGAGAALPAAARPAGPEGGAAGEGEGAAGGPPRQAQEGEEQQAAQEPAPQQQPEQQQQQQPAPPPPPPYVPRMCVICADRAEAVAVGPCDHSEICHHCCLRLRILYRDARCPLCKADNATVYLTAAASSAPAATVAEGGAPQPQPQPHAPPPPPPPPPSFEELEAARARAPDRFYSGKRWALGVHVDKAMPDPPPALLAPGGGVAAAAALRAWQGRWRVPLHVQLLQWTSRSCPVCDPLVSSPAWARSDPSATKCHLLGASCRLPSARAFWCKPPSLRPWVFRRFPACRVPPPLWFATPPLLQWAVPRPPLPRAATAGRLGHPRSCGSTC
jgi:hypothetical protein